MKKITTEMSIRICEGFLTSLLPCSLSPSALRRSLFISLLLARAAVNGRVLVLPDKVPFLSGQNGARSPAILLDVLPLGLVHVIPGRL
jgi:hypothetical protein